MMKGLILKLERYTSYIQICSQRPLKAPKSPLQTQGWVDTTLSQKQPQNRANFKTLRTISEEEKIDIIKRGQSGSENLFEKIL
jgi:hypothetical protein